MKLEWTKSQREYLNKPIPVTKTDWDQAIWFLVFLISLSGLIYLFIR